MFIYILQERKYGGFVNVVATLDGQIVRFAWLNDYEDKTYLVRSLEKAEGPHKYTFTWDKK